MSTVCAGNWGWTRAVAQLAHFDGHHSAIPLREAAAQVSPSLQISVFRCAAYRTVRCCRVISSMASCVTRTVVMTNYGLGYGAAHVVCTPEYVHANGESVRGMIDFHERPSFVAPRVGTTSATTSLFSLDRGQTTVDEG